MGYYVIVTTRKHETVKCGWFATREEALALMGEVMRGNLDNIESVELSRDVPPGATP